VKRLVAWIAGRRAGELELKANGNLRFKYDAAYDGPPISQALPVQPDAHPHDRVHAVFGGLLPEGEVRQALAHNLGLSTGNEYGLLEQVGGDVAGAITLLPPGVDPPSAPEVRPLDDDDLARLLDELPQRPLAADAAQGIRLSLAGAQPKLPVIVRPDGARALPTNTAAATTHILKPEPGRFPGLVDNEAFCMELARACGLPVPKVEKAVTTGGLPYLIVERYDRRRSGDAVQRLHQEDLCQALGVPAERKYQQEGGPTFAQCAELVRHCAEVPARELPNLLGYLAFNWMIGNCDAHAKNYALLYEEGVASLAPLYDAVSTVAYPEHTTRLAMNIGSARVLGDVDDAAWTQLARASGYRAEFVASTVADLLDRAAEEAAALIARDGHDNETAREIQARITTLAGARSG